jgi:hypothetical protein
MAHQRKLIRDAIVAALTGETAAADRVRSTRLTPWRKGALPAISVYAVDEDVDPAKSDAAPRKLHRVVNMTIEGVLAETNEDQLDDALDALAEEIEVAMDADPYLGGVAADSMLLRTELGTATLGERPHGAVQLTYAVTFQTNVPEAGATVDLETASIKHDLGGAVHTDNQAEDRLENLDL